MKKFYFLNENKQWQGPYRFPYIVFFALKGTIKPATYLWHNRLSTNIGEHPSTSIYERKKANEFRSLPIWIYRYNLRIMALNRIQKWKKWKNKNDWTNFTAKPIQTSETPKNAVKIYLIPSITAIHDFGAPENFNVKLTYLDNDKNVKVLDYAIKLLIDNNPGIEFEITMPEPPAVGGVKYKESYGLHRELILVSKNENIAVVKNAVFNFSTQYPYQPQILKGRFKQANLISNHSYKNVYNRLLLKVDDDKIINPGNLVAHTGLHFYDHEQFNVHSSLMGPSFKTVSSFTQVTIGGLRYNFYSVVGNVIIIDGADKEDLETFKQKSEIIRIALAVLSGKFYGGECNYVTSADSNFEQIHGVWYEMEKVSVLSGRRTIDLQIFRSTFKETDEDYCEKYESVNTPISPSIFSALCEALWTNENLLHASNLIISGMGNNDPLQQGALYSVALETLTATLGKAKSKELKPISDTQLSKTFIADLKKVLSSHKNEISPEGQNILEKNIEEINRPTNRDKLVKTFELYGISLSNTDKETIDKRNAYLHGRSPLNRKHTFELTQISLRLHTLLVALLLKSIGYSGHIINLDVYIYLTNEEKMLELNEKEQAIYKNLVDQMEQAISDRDESKFRALKEDLGMHIKNNKFLDLIRVI